jgi:hypothetical protein
MTNIKWKSGGIMKITNLHIELDTVKLHLDRIKNAKSLKEIDNIIKNYEKFNEIWFDVVTENANHTYGTTEERALAFKEYKDKPKGLLHLQMIEHESIPTTKELREMAKDL